MPREKVHMPTHAQRGACVGMCANSSPGSDDRVLHLVSELYGTHPVRLADAVRILLDGGSPPEQVSPRFAHGQLLSWQPNL